MTDFNFNNIKLIIGLGNIGKEFERTRHNAGFMFVDFFTDYQTFSLNKSLNTSILKSSKIFAKPTTMMNNSGIAAVKLLNYFKLKPYQMLVCFDDLDISFSEYKIQFDKGPKIHNGLNSIEDYLQTQKFWRLRIGIDNRTQEIRNFQTGADYVLERFSTEEIDTLNQTFVKIKTNLESLHE